MPVYEHKCPKCGHETEDILSFNSPAPKCEKCNTQTKRKISKGAFHLKGSGWYKDHYGLKEKKS